MDPQIRYKEKSVIIHRDESGFGFRVGGQNPVFVDCVHENGAAWKAGVRKEDRIIKVNGTLVRSYDHQRVVHMIQNCTPFVNLTLHSPEPIIVEPLISGCDSQSGADQIESVGQGGSIDNSANYSINATNNNNLLSSPMKTRLHPNSISNNSNWLLQIGDDLFLDSQHHKSTQQQVGVDVSPSHPSSSGVSKLVEFGPTIPSNSGSHQNSSIARPKLRQSKNQSSTRDNPYYYYKTAPEKASDATTCNTSNSSFTNQQDPNSSKSSASLSIVRSRSSSKMSTRSSSGKYKTRKLRSRLVGDFRSLTIANMQTTPSSLSTSPSSSDLSNCDYEPGRASTIVTGSSGANFVGPNVAGQTKNVINQQQQQSGPIKPKRTTHRLEIIRELVDTEKTHTERLKHLNDLVYKPIKAEGLVPADQLKMIFSCHKTLFKIHRQIYKILSAAQINVCECHQEPLVGRALIEIFEGELGKRLDKAASTFCACQSINTELLNRFTRKDSKAGEFLAQVANQQMLGRLGIKDLLASCFQRLTKYPLLLENLLKATPTGEASGHSKSLSEGSATSSATISAPCPDKLNPVSYQFVINNENSSVDNQTTDTTSANPNQNDLQAADTEAAPVEDIPIAIATTGAATAPNDIDNSANKEQEVVDDEYAYERLCIKRSLYQSRQILKNVNEAVNRAISQNRLRDIWKKTDKYPDLAVIDIENQQIIHEGPLTLRLARRSFEVYVLLLTHYLIILTREGQEKYKLKYFSSDGKIAKQFSPIFNIDEHLATRDTATDENGFYLLCKKKDDSRIYEFASQSPTERAKWKEMIHTARLFNFAAVPNDDNTLNRYSELISLALPPSNTIELSPSTSANTGG